jgi:TPP-dependent pyruvate/acetoin dehydrogenase alpha subunit
MVARAAAMRGRDPVQKLRARLEVDRGRLEALEHEVESAVRAAVEAALASLEEVPA